MDVVSVSVPCADRDEARAIASALVEHRLAACVHLSPISSIYEWEGVVRADDEVVIVAATHRSRMDDLVAFVRAAHSYDLPAISWVPVDGTDEYLAWVSEQVQMRSK